MKLSAKETNPDNLLALVGVVRMVSALAQPNKCTKLFCGPLNLVENIYLKTQVRWPDKKTGVWLDAGGSIFLC